MFQLAVLVVFLGNICFGELTREEIETNQALWLGEGINSYNYEYNLICFCDACTTFPVTVEVRDGVVASVSYVDPDDPIIVEYCSGEDNPTPAYTIDTLFTILLFGFDNANGTVTATFDETLGIPTSVSIDYETNVADDETAWNIDASSFEEITCKELTCDWECDILYSSTPFGCSCDLDVHDGTCRENLCESPGGCSQCMSNYFKLDYSYYCVNCQEAAGEHCMHCTDFGGCQQCQQGYTREFNDECGFWYCKEDFCD